MAEDRPEDSEEVRFLCPSACAWRRLPPAVCACSLSAVGAQESSVLGYNIAALLVLCRLASIFRRA